ncbi:MAG: amidophosphoribosyltransferase [Spirochaetes bacterium]|nr:amidophosphoribosyltransferase [Spirochaetota bacterium]
MGGFFGAALNKDCAVDLFYGTDYHSHLGTKRGGLSILDNGRFIRFIHDITNAQFKSKFEEDINKMHGKSGIGIISDSDNQPLIIGSHLGTYSIVTVGAVKNMEEIAQKTFRERTTHFSEMSGDEINSTELISTIINRGASFIDGINNVSETIDGSCSMLILTKDGIYAVRDKYGRTPVIIGKCENGYSVATESACFPNIGYEIYKELGPGETVFITSDSVETVIKPKNKLQICAFLWIYYGYPSSSYEGINVEESRYNCGAALAKNDRVEIDYVAGIPDSGTAHAIGYSFEAKVPFKRPYVKYTPSWSRSFMPQNQEARDLVAKMKLIPIKELTTDKKILFCDDSIVRGTQLKNTFKKLFYFGAKEIHMRIACPPLLFSCKFLNFSRSSSEMDLASNKAIQQIEGNIISDKSEYLDPKSDKYCKMVEIIRKKIGVTTLSYLSLPDMIKAIGLPEENICSYCWNGKECK